MSERLLLFDSDGGSFALRRVRGFASMGEAAGRGHEAVGFLT